MGISPGAPEPATMTAAEQDDLPGYALRTGQAVLLVVSGLVGASVLLGALPPLVDAGVVPPAGVGYEVARIVAQFAGFGAVVGLFVAGTGDRDLIGVAAPDRFGAALIGGGVLGLLALQFAALWLLGWLGIDAGTNVVVELGREDPTLFLVLIPLSLLVVGPGEELLFRGGVQGILRRAWGPWGAIVGASLLFGAIHFPGVSGGVAGRLVYVVVAAGLGGVLGWQYERTDNLVVPAVTHGAYNATLFLLQYLDITGAI